MDGYGVRRRRGVWFQPAALVLLAGMGRMANVGWLGLLLTVPLQFSAAAHGVMPPEVALLLWLPALAVLGVGVLFNAVAVGHLARCARHRGTLAERERPRRVSEGPQEERLRFELEGGDWLEVLSSRFNDLAVGESAELLVFGDAAIPAARLDRFVHVPGDGRLRPRPMLAFVLVLPTLAGAAALFTTWQLLTP